jgi:hypothetical protein
MVSPTHSMMPSEVACTREIESHPPVSATHRGGDRDAATAKLTPPRQKRARARMEKGHGRATSSCAQAGAGAVAISPSTIPIAKRSARTRHRKDAGRARCTRGMC